MNKYKYLIIALPLLSLIFISVMANPPETINSNTPKMDITFKGLENDSIQEAFLEVYKKYEVLHPHEVILKQKRLKKTTMQAQPIIDLSSIFQEKKSYTIKVAHTVRDTPIRISSLPEDVLKGWFAHELGHIVDYEKRSNLGMFVYGMKYLLSDDFKKDVEHKADSIAIQHGFDKEIIATKKFLLKNEFVKVSYKNQLKKYYMPISGVEMCVKDAKTIMPRLD